MNQINAIVSIRPTRLNFPLTTLHARQLHSLIVELRDIPDDITYAAFRIYKTDKQTHFDIPVSRKPDGTSGLAYIIGTCFLDSGDSFYEVHAFDCRGNMTALGTGMIEILPFGGTSEPIPPGASIPLMQVFDKNGGAHTIMAVSDGCGNFTTILDDTESE